MADHDWMLSDHGGVLVLAVMLQSHKSPGLCEDCLQEIKAGEYYMKHKNRTVWHNDCHFKRQAKPVPKSTQKLRRMGKGRGFFQ